ncbi:HET-domain-containing protein [Corynespora cassiicola Philippines]|uniref:HET-domain-containing protein n=1 Tax=Corynespora cassiicola Philippines TaxID=1448308 RepID=A0A2T2P4B5_CORCC|nr:HET-domain-containing protein [Corynespora cassiicola Philippines]
MSLVPKASEQIIESQNGGRRVFDPCEDECSVCRHKLFFGLYKDLLLGSDQGCSWRQLILACVQWETRNLSYTERLEDTWIAMQPAGAINMLSHDRQSETHLECLRLLPDGSVLTLYDNQPRRLLPHSTSSKATIHQIKDWIDTCQKHHSCDSIFERAPMDSFSMRILDLRNDTIVLREDVRPLKYACLSHCWGSGKNIYKTTRKTLSSHCCSIGLRELPKTFQDAIQVCRDLDIAFLWIDSLCIVQDDNEDWQNQAGQMAGIYQNAVVVIAASKASEPTEGFFSEAIRTYRGAPLPGYEGLYIRRSRHPFLASKDSSHQLPLFSRAWTFQELFIAKRVVHFGNEGVTWQCQKELESQCLSPISLDFGSPVTSIHTRGSVVDFSWKELLWEYTSRELSFFKDRLPAIAAVAEMKQKLHGKEKEYIAGLWKDSLLNDLTWYSCLNRTWRPKEPSPGIPTWSWASIAGQVEWESRHSHQMNNVLVLDTLYVVNGSPYSGVIERARISLRAPLIRMEGSKTPTYTITSISLKGVAIKQTLLLQPLGNCGTLSIEATWDPRRYQHRQALSIQNLSLLVLNVPMYPNRSGFFNAIILLRVNEQHVYERVGQARISGAGTSGKSLPSNSSEPYIGDYFCSLPTECFDIV